MVLGIVAFLLSALFWSISDYVVILKLTSCTVFQVVFMRHVIMFLLSFSPFYIGKKYIKNHGDLGFWGMRFNKYTVVRSLLTCVALNCLMYGFKLNLSVSSMTAISYSIPLFTMIFNLRSEKPQFSTLLFFSLMCIPLFCLKIKLSQVYIPLIGCALFGACDILIKHSKNTTTEEIRTSAFIISILNLAVIFYQQNFIYTQPILLYGLLLGVLNYCFISLLIYSFQKVPFNKLFPFRFAQLILNNTVDQRNILDWRNFVVAFFMLVELIK